MPTLDWIGKEAVEEEIQDIKLAVEWLFGKAGTLNSLLQ